MEKLSMENMRSSLAIQRVTDSSCVEGQIKARKQRTLLALWLPKLRVQHYRVICKATRGFLRLDTPVVCSGVQHFLQEKEDTCSEWKQQSCFP